MYAQSRLLEEKSVNAGTDYLEPSETREHRDSRHACSQEVRLKSSTNMKSSRDRKHDDISEHLHHEGLRDTSITMPGLNRSADSACQH